MPHAVPLETAVRTPSTWDALRLPVFRTLWLAWFASNLSMWMNDVAAAWLMTSLTTSPVLVALVQSASTLPVFLLGLPSGALADILNRRHLLLATQFWVASMAIVLCAVLFADLMTAPLLLALTFANGIGLAMRWPVYSAIVPQLVPREDLQSAIALNGVAMNSSRVIGPVVAGVMIAGAGSQYVFLINAVLSLIAGYVVLRWRSEEKVSILPGERFVGAMRVGFQYVAQSKPIRAVLLRVGVFFLQSTALLALLPLVAKHMQAGGAWTYTTLLASLGLGAVIAAMWLPRLRALIGRDRLLRDGSVVHGVAMVCVGFAPNIWVAVPAMMIAGAAWLSVVNTLTVSAQLALPDWVRARGMSIYMMTMMGAASASAALWGQVAVHIDVQWSFVVAVLTGLSVLFLTRRFILSQEQDVDLTPSRGVPEPVAAFPIEHGKGPVMVTIEYQVDPARLDEFMEVMFETRSDRLRKGALSWGLFHDISEPNRYLEYYLDDSWADHLRRFERFTTADAELRERRQSFHLGAEAPRVARYVAESMTR
ncbi:MAG TPA: MFS transporter [Burkholderiaceae bacterium]|nr:MFS transporter [Burkholderiaceae bacterium]